MLFIELKILVLQRSLWFPVKGCESISEIPIIYDTSFEEIETVTIRQNIPIIVIDAMFNWSILNEFTLDNLTEIYRQQHQHYMPCHLLTSINIKSKYVLDFLEIIQSSFMKKWFLTWKNCELKTAKTIRNFYQQPYFIKYFLPASNINSVLLSYNYKSPNFKQFNVESRKLLILMQQRGSMNFQLSPREECKNICLPINGTLNEMQTCRAMAFAIFASIERN
ncbi:hypothetical protein PGB90_004305 [Kerria lacca]